MSEDSRAKKLIEQFDSMANERYTYERNWQDIRELVRPTASDFQRKGTKGEVRSEGIYDGTAVQALDELASALHSYMTSPTERWFDITLDSGLDGAFDLNRDPEVVEWLEIVSDIIYNEYSNESTEFNQSMHEAYLDVGGFGTSIIFQEYDPLERHLSFQTKALADCYLRENSRLRVDTCFRRLSMTVRQMIQQFGEEALPSDVLRQDDFKEFEVIHATLPRSDRNSNKLTRTNKRWASFWVLKEKAIVLSEGGYDTFPYHIARWTKTAGEIYGRGPAVKCLPDIRMLNRMEFTIIKAAQKAVDPPLLVVNDGYMLPIKQSPGALIFKEPNAEPIEALEHKGNLPIGLDMSNQKREFIKGCFFAEFVKLVPKKERQTAFEISELVDQQLRMMAPMLARLQSEQHSPIIARSYQLLHNAGRIPPAPALIQGRGLKVAYSSTAARAQRGIAANNASRYVQELLPIAQFEPSVMDKIDPDGFAEELARLRSVTRRILRSPDAVAQLRQDREAAQVASQVAEIAKPASEAVRNLAQANESGGLVAA